MLEIIRNLLTAAGLPLTVGEIALRLWLPPRSVASLLHRGCREGALVRLPGGRFAAAHAAAAADWEAQLEELLATVRRCEALWPEPEQGPRRPGFMASAGPWDWGLN